MRSDVISKPLMVSRAIAYALNISIREAYQFILDQVHLMKLMPDDNRCLTEALRAAGFERHGRTTRIYTYDDTLKLYSENSAEIQSIIVFGNLFMNGYIIDKDDPAGYSLLLGEKVLNTDRFPVREYWTRKYSIDNAHDTEKAVAKKERKIRKIMEKPDQYYYHFHQQNPDNNGTGDCLVRALSSVLDMTWDECIDELVKYYEYGDLNNEAVFARLLADYGAQKFKPMKKRGRPVSSSIFCAEMTEAYTHGERVLAMSGRSHAVAVLPVRQKNGTVHYEIFDNWDSSARNILDYWVYTPKSKKHGALSGTAIIGEMLIPGLLIDHPTYGQGQIRDVSNKYVIASFNSTAKKLSKDWLMKNCVCSTAEERKTLQQSNKKSNL